VFKASVTHLIPLYAIGVFTSLTFSQLGMAKHHITKKEEGWRVGLFFNGLGGIVSGVMTIIIAAVKFNQGAWAILLAIPIMLFGLLRVNKHYKEAGASLRDPARRGALRETPRQIVIIPVAEPGRANVYAAAYASRVFPIEVRLVHFAEWGEPLDELIDRWSRFGHSVDFLPRKKSIPEDLLDYVHSVRAEAGTDALINVVVPETVEYTGFRHLLHKRHLQRLKATLVADGDRVKRAVRPLLARRRATVRSHLRRREGVREGRPRVGRVELQRAAGGARLAVPADHAPDPGLRARRPGGAASNLRYHRHPRVRRREVLALRDAQPDAADAEGRLPLRAVRRGFLGAVQAGSLAARASSGATIAPRLRDHRPFSH